MEISGKVALVTGASRGIGKEIALLLARNGADVAINFRSREREAEEVKEAAIKSGRRAITVKASVSDVHEVESMVKTVNEELGKIDILVNNAGIVRDKLLVNMSDSDLLEVIQTNLIGAINCARSVIFSMMRRKSGRIVNIASLSGITGFAGQTNYSAAKGGLIAFTKSLAKEVALLGIRVNAVAPGFIETDMLENLQKKDEIMKYIPLGRFGRPEEVAEAVLYLVSDRSDYLTGQVIKVDGGLMM